MYTLFQEMRAQAHPENAAFMQAYMKHQFVFLGIKTPLRRKLSMPWLREMKKKTVDWTFLACCFEQAEREFQYVACDYLIAVKNQILRSDLDQIEKLICTKSWWDTVDALDEVVGDLHLRQDIRDRLLRWSLDDNIWLRRVAIDHQLQYKEKTDQALLGEIIRNNLSSSEFFIQKAIGWALREYGKTNPDWVRQFVSGHALPALSRREALKHL